MLRICSVVVLGVVSTSLVVAQASSSSSPQLGSTATITVMPVGELPSKRKIETAKPGDPIYNQRVRAFSKVGVAIKAGTLGAGFEVATPLSRSFNLRAGASFVDFGTGFTTDGVDYEGELHFKSGQVNLDWFPFHGGFHVSPGVLILGSELNATAKVPGGSHFTLNEVDYTSSPADPIHGTGRLDFGRMTSPSLTVGWGNIVPRSGKHWSVPFEIGAAFVGQSHVTLNLAGTACQTLGCFNAATDPTIQANIRDEQNTLNDDLKPLQVYPLVSLGVSYKF